MLHGHSHSRAPFDTLQGVFSELSHNIVVEEAGSVHAWGRQVLLLVLSLGFSLGETTVRFGNLSLGLVFDEFVITITSFSEVVFTITFFSEVIAAVTFFSKVVITITSFSEVVITITSLSEVVLTITFFSEVIAAVTFFSEIIIAFIGSKSLFVNDFIEKVIVSTLSKSVFLLTRELRGLSSTDKG